MKQIYISCIASMLFVIGICIIIYCIDIWGYSMSDNLYLLLLTMSVSIGAFHGGYIGYVAARRPFL